VLADVRGGGATKYAPHVAEKLVYHRLDAPSRTSPFARAIAKIARGGKVDVVGPYLSVERLNELVSHTTSWRLVTDAQEWLRAEGHEAQRAADFIEAHHKRVRDCRGVHAKVVIGTEEALVGSANLTAIAWLSQRSSSSKPYNAHRGSGSGQARMLAKNR
jgi:hypothetical protein